MVALAVVAAALARLPDVAGQSAPATQAAAFQLEEVTIASLIADQQAGRRTARAIAEQYLGRIAALDRAGPSLRAVIELNPDASWPSGRGSSRSYCRARRAGSRTRTSSRWTSDYSPAPDARRFDAGTPPIPNIYAGLAGMSLSRGGGQRAIEAHIAGLATRLIDGLDELGATVGDPAARGPLVCVRSNDVNALVDALAAERIACSERDSNLRVSLHFYNTADDVDAVLAALARRREALA